MVSFGGETNYANTDHEVHTNKATNSYYLSLISVNYSWYRAVVKFKEDSGG